MAGADDASLAPGARLLGFWEPEASWLPCALRRRRRGGGVDVEWEDGSWSRLAPEEVRPRPCGEEGDPQPRAKRRRGEDAPRGEDVPRPMPLAPQAGKVLPPHRYVMAPMVGGSELPFRALARRFGAQLCYTPMIYSGPFAADEAYRAAPENGFQTCDGDRPLVAHFCGNDPEVLLAAARHVERAVDAVDLNLGCPQRVAHAGHFGSYLLDRGDRELVCRIVKRLSDSLPVPVFCKIRLLDSLEDTIELSKQLEASGASLLAVHARYRGSPTHRRDGPAHLEQVRFIKQALRIPVVANGNVRSWDDVQANLRTTGADGIMSAEGMLDDPCLFAGGGGSKLPAQAVALRKVEKKLRQVDTLRQRLADGATLSKEELAKVEARKSLRAERRRLLAESAEEPPEPSGREPVPCDGLAKARLYLEMTERHWVPPLSTLIFHCRRMARAELAAYQLLEEFAASKTWAEAEAVLRRAEGYRDSPGSFVADEARAKSVQELREKIAYEQQCRKKFEARMARKAERTGRPLEALLKATACPGGVLSFSAEPSWLAEKDGEGAAEAEGSGPGGARGGRGRGRGLGRGRGR